MAAGKIPEPILSWNFQLADETGNAEPGCEPWRIVGQHDVWLGRYPAGQPTLRVQEIHGNRVAEFGKPGAYMHRIPAGTPYRISHLFGFWHVSDADLTWLQFERAEMTLYVALAGGETGLAGDHAIAWYCAQCGEQITRQELPGAGGTGDLLTDGSRAAIEAFNADAARRRCPACGWEHPPAYPFSPLDGRAPDAQIPAW
jgi:predicted RNA-binding Zn-ribbon protein involved in translation (DUF1610 family)